MPQPIELPALRGPAPLTHSRPVSSQHTRLDSNLSGVPRHPLSPSARDGGREPRAAASTRPPPAGEIAPRQYALRPYSHSDPPPWGRRSRVILRSRAFSSALTNSRAAVAPDSRSRPRADPRARPSRWVARKRAGSAARELPPGGGREECMTGPRRARMPIYGAGSKYLGRHRERDKNGSGFTLRRPPSIPIAPLHSHGSLGPLHTGRGSGPLRPGFRW